MRSLMIKAGFFSVALALAGCLVSEEPILDAKTGKAKPLGVGPHLICPLGEDADDSDCERFTIAVDETGLYQFTDAEDDDDDAKMRFRPIARDGYAVQSYEEDGAMYYYGRGDRNEFRLTMMNCPSLSAKTRDQLLDRGDLAADEGDYSICQVKSLKGLTVAAREYHRRRTNDGDEEIVLEITPASER